MQAGGVLSKVTGLRRGKLFEKLRISTIETRLADFKCKMIVNDWAQPKTKRVVLRPHKLTPSNLGESDCPVTSIPAVTIPFPHRPNPENFFSWDYKIPVKITNYKILAPDNKEHVQ